MKTTPITIPVVANDPAAALRDQGLMNIISDNFDAMIGGGVHPASALTILLNVTLNLVARIEPEAERKRMLKFLRDHMTGKDIAHRRVLIAAAQAEEETMQ